MEKVAGIMLEILLMILLFCNHADGTYQCKSVAVPLCTMLTPVRHTDGILTCVLQPSAQRFFDKKEEEDSISGVVVIHEHILYHQKGQNFHPN